MFLRNVGEHALGNTASHLKNRANLHSHEHKTPNFTCSVQFLFAINEYEGQRRIKNTLWRSLFVSIGTESTHNYVCKHSNYIEAQSIAPNLQATVIYSIVTVSRHRASHQIYRLL
jgi:hypothetical protein